MDHQDAVKIFHQVGAIHPGSANVLAAAMSKVMQVAIEQRVRKDNPFLGIKRYKLKKRRGWTDEEIAQFEKRWPLGTRERLAFALLLYTCQRGGDVANMKRADIIKGMIRVCQDKQRKGEAETLEIPIHPELHRALDAGPVVGLTHLLTNARGQPFKWGLTDFIERAVELAGLPSACKAHGLRKAGLRRLAEAGCTVNQMKAVSGQKTLAVLQEYIEDADQKRLAKAAIAKLPMGEK